MPVRNYHCVNGRLIAEITTTVRTDYMTDALGSVTGTLNSSQTVVNTYRYKPYGELLAKTGAGVDPAFLWNGTTQSRKTGLAYSDQYNRARHYGTRQGQWTTVDPLWPGESAYGYARQNPGTLVDPEGDWPNTGRATCYDPEILTVSNRLCKEDPLQIFSYEKGFCNKHPEILACTRYGSGMNAAWPNVKWYESRKEEKCCPDGHTARSKCDVYPAVSSINQPGLGDTVPCGTNLRVSKGNRSIVVRVVDAGPAAPPKANAMIDLTPTAAKALYAQLGKKFTKCSLFAVESVTVTVEKS